MQSIKDTQILNSVSETYEGIAESWDRVRRRPGQVWNALLPYIPEGVRVLDVGCGNGRLSEFLAPKKVDYTGVDGSAKLIEIASARYISMSFPPTSGNPENDRGSRVKPGMTTTRFLMGNMLSLPLANSSFDVICCLAAFHHLPSEHTRLMALQEMLRVTRPGGVLLTTNWNLYHPTMSFRYRLWPLLWGRRDVFIPWNLPEEQSVYQRYYHSFLLSELRALLPKAGWTLDAARYIHNTGPAHIWNGLFSFVVAKKPLNQLQ